MKILVSACLLGDNCKYNGENNYNEKVCEFLKDKEYIKVCPEVMGKLSIPRDPCEISGDKVLTSKGKDVTNNYLKGALKVLEIIEKEDIDLAIMKANSPSCGSNYIYDGAFSHNLTLGDGITTKLLKEKGIKVITEKDL